MKFIKSLLILSFILLTSISFGQNGDLGKARTIKFTKQVDNKFVEIVFQAQPGDYLGGETYFKLKLEQIIVHQWEIDGKLYTSSNSQGILPANGKLGHVYLDVKIKTINNPFNEFWVKEGFQMNKMTDFQDIDYDGRTDKKWWINYAHVSDVNINSVHFSNWFEIEKQLKALEGNNITVSNTTIKNQTSNNNTTAVSKQNKSLNTSSQIQKVATEMNLREDELKILEIVSNTDNLNDALAQLNQLGYQNFNKYTIDALNKLSTSITDFPLTGNEMNTLLNGGSFKDIQKSYNLRQSTKVALKLGLNNSQTELINIIATSENNEDLNQRIKEKNIRDISNLSQNALNKLLGANNTIFPASSSDITAMINGNWEQALTNINNEMQTRNTMKNAGVDRQTASDLNALGSAIGNSINESMIKNRQEKEKIRLLQVEKFNKDLSLISKEKDFTGKKEHPFQFIIEKDNIKINNNLTTTYKDDNELVINISKDNYTKFSNNEDIFKITDSKFNPYNDFTIEFEIGYVSKQLDKNKGKRPNLYLQLSNYIIDLDNNWSSTLFLNLPEKIKEKYSGIGALSEFSKNIVEYDKMIEERGFVTTYDLRKKEKKLLKNIRNIAKRNNQEDFFWTKIKITAKNGFINCSEILNLDNTFTERKSENLKLYYFEDNIIRFTIYNMEQNDKIAIKNFNINQ